MPTTPPDALLFITTACAHCPAVLQGLSELVKQALIGKLTVVNIAAHPELAAEFGVRSAPWLRLGNFTLTGAFTLSELRQWVNWSSSDEGIAHYVEHLLKQGGFKQAGVFIAEDTQRLKPLLAIVADPEKSIEVRVGVDALLEFYANSSALQSLLPQLMELSQHPDHRVRADACHLMGLSGSDSTQTYLAKCLNDSYEEVREIAAESLVLISSVKS